MEKEQLNYGERDSIEVSRDAKGIYRWTAKIYFNAADGNDEVIKRLKDADTRLRAEFL